MVAGALAIVNDRDTSRAKVYTLLPGCWAITVHWPTAVSVTVFPVMVQSPLAKKLTGRPELAEALTVKDASVMILSASGSNVMVCASVSRSPPGSPHLL